MKRLILLFGLALAGVAHAETYEIALPELAGDFDSGFLAPNTGPQMRSTTFSIPVTITSIDQIQLALSGTNADGAVICIVDVGGGQTEADTTTVATRMRLVLAAQSLGEDCFVGQMDLPVPDFSGAAVTLGSCAAGATPDPDLLLGVQIHAELSCSYLTDCTHWFDALVTLDDVRLVIQGQGVAVAGRAWGAIKALYR